MIHSQPVAHSYSARDRCEGKSTHQTLEDRDNVPSVHPILATGWRWVSESTRIEQSTCQLGERNVIIMRWQTSLLITETYILFGWPWRVRIVNNQNVNKDRRARVTYKLSGVRTRWVLLCKPFIDVRARWYRSLVPIISGQDMINIHSANTGWIQGIMWSESLAIATCSHPRVKEPVKMIDIFKVSHYERVRWLTFCMG
jgi:hypothetical protein